MNIARVEKTDEFKYKLSGKNIERVQKEKDIGVTIDSELTFESHICEKVNKATSIFGALRRAFRYLDKKGNQTNSMDEKLIIRRTFEEA